MTIEERIVQAIGAINIPVTQIPVKGDGEKYIAFELTSGTPDGYASNDARRVDWLCTLHLFSRKAPLSSEIVSILQALKTAELKPVSWGPNVYETDTRWHHFPISIRVKEAF